MFYSSRLEVACSRRRLARAGVDEQGTGGGLNPSVGLPTVPGRLDGLGLRRPTRLHQPAEPKVDGVLGGRYGRADVAPG